MKRGGGTAASSAWEGPLLCSRDREANAAAGTTMATPTERGWGALWPGAGGRGAHRGWWGMISAHWGPIPSTPAWLRGSAPLRYRCPSSQCQPRPPVFPKRVEGSCSPGCAGTSPQTSPTLEERSGSHAGLLCGAGGWLPPVQTGGVFWEQARTSVTNRSYAAPGMVPRQVATSPVWKILSVNLSILLWL